MKSMSQAQELLKKINAKVDPALRLSREVDPDSSFELVLADQRRTVLYSTTKIANVPEFLKGYLARLEQE